MPTFSESKVATADDSSGAKEDAVRHVYLLRSLSAPRNGTPPVVDSSVRLLKTVCLRREET
jgi:hypothetical protein